MGYRWRIPKDQIIFFKVSVKSTSDIYKVYFKQLEPIPDVSGLQCNYNMN